MMRPWPGRPHPLGATWDGEGVNVSVFAGHATGVDLCVFDEEGHETRVALPERTRGAWHGYLPGAGPGLEYGYRVHGPRDPARGLWHDPAKLLADPWARAYRGSLRWDPALGRESAGRDTAPFVPRSLVVDPAFDWGADQPPRTPWSRTLVYEAHVRNLTLRHPDVPAHLRGTYLGLASEPVIEHLRALGVTAVELLPVFAFATERHLLESGRRNAWGYSPFGFLAPHAGYATGDDGRQVHELKLMVKALHRAGLEVIVDACFGHTAEGGESGMAVSLAGLDAASWFRMERGRHVDFTGCGNTLDASRPRGLQLVMDSCRYWVEEMHVDGFRFDQATVLGRERPDFDRESTFFATLAQDPVLAHVKLIAEPWDLGPGGYRLGGFPEGWAEWNDRFRDDVRRFWRGDEGLLPPLASRLSGSSDVFGGSGRGPSSSVNFVACHDGFTLRDLTSYSRKRNERNGEGNRDGRDENFSCAWGAEGDTHDAVVLRRRSRVQRALLATLALAQGVPMIAMGDEMGRTQAGNNNAYCLDDGTTWVDWHLDRERKELLDLARRAFAARRTHPVLRRRAFFHGRHLGEGEKDITWLHPEGREMTMADWGRPEARELGMLISALSADYVDERGHAVSGATLLVLVNGSPRRVRFRVPQVEGARWREVLRTSRRATREGSGGTLVAPPVSVTLFEREELA